MDFIGVHGKGKWNRVAKMTGLKRGGKSCRLRWINYLSPGVKRGDFSEEEDDLIIRLHNLLGNRWSLIAGRVPGRTDNQVKNHWNTHLSKKLGFKKGISKGKASSNSEEVEENPSMPQVANSKKLTEHEGGGATGPTATHDGSHEATRSDFSAQGAAISSAHDQMGSFFPFVYDNMNLYTPDVIEYMDECSLDFIWHGL
ncbi:hypothetical protein CRG98_012996 [Punica granatum]|nr:hypothetical protein CRG98_012996 [Punica granatum]